MIIMLIVLDPPLDIGTLLSAILKMVCNMGLFVLFFLKGRVVLYLFILIKKNITGY